MKLRSKSFERLYLCTDRQDYMVNWGNRRARKTVQLTAIATADLKSGYLFAMTPNFDKSMLPADLEDAAEKASDANKPIPMRDFARVWTQADYAGSVQRTATGSSTARADLDAPEGLTNEQQLPRDRCAGPCRLSDARPLLAAALSTPECGKISVLH